ncbi:hypothetical protein JJB09_24675 [Rhizobium sp. KVB221]|uniref:Uncharacterized protein n=2 Tax=Rhizobium setariae TaxID=2801340 RepID=A0A937CN91_9HYPH|nr:hypothetical protein [Rhizobium setariae]
MPENDEARKAVCDSILGHATDLMMTDAGASLEMVIDRVMTFVAAQIASLEGSPRAAQVFREVADKIEAGLFHRITGENDTGSARH